MVSFYCFGLRSSFAQVKVNTDNIFIFEERSKYEIKSLYEFVNSNNNNNNNNY